MKYIITIDDNNNLLPIIFPEDISHSSIAAGAKRDRLQIRSAGFCYINRGEYIVAGRSDSLNIASHEDDRDIINEMIGQGLSQLDKDNLNTLEWLKRVNAQK